MPVEYGPTQYTEGVEEEECEKGKERGRGGGLPEGQRRGSTL